MPRKKYHIFTKEKKKVYYSKYLRFLFISFISFSFNHWHVAMGIIWWVQKNCVNPLTQLIENVKIKKILQYYTLSMKDSSSWNQNWEQKMLWSRNGAYSTMYARMYGLSDDRWLRASFRTIWLINETKLNTFTENLLFEMERLFLFLFFFFFFKPSLLQQIFKTIYPLFEREKEKEEKKKKMKLWL